MTQPPQPRTTQSWEHLLERDPHSGAGFRIGIVAAVLIHAAIFAVTWPTVAQAPPETPPETYIPVQLVDVIPPETEPPPLEIELPEPIDEASVIVPGPPQEIPTEPIERELSPPVITTGAEAPALEYIAPPPPPPEPPSHDTPVLILEPPELLHEVTPRYTEPARRAGIEGAVILDLVIDAEGRVASATVLRGLPLGLTEAATDAVARWRFAPSVFNGRPVAVRYILTVWFNLD